jgi:hypothetical protein
LLFLIFFMFFDVDLNPDPCDLFALAILLKSLLSGIHCTFFAFKIARTVSRDFFLIIKFLFFNYLNVI